MTTTDDRLELIIADAAIRRPELLDELADIVNPDDFTHTYLRLIYAAAICAHDEQRGHGYHAVHQVLVDYGHHHHNRDICHLYELGGTGQVITTHDALAAAAILTERAQARRIRQAARQADRALAAGRPTDHVTAELLEAIAR